MNDIFWGLFILITAAFCWFGLIHCVHWLSRMSCKHYGRRGWFWLATAMVLLLGVAATLYNGIDGLYQLVWGLTTYGL
jgi:hypothetical protein